MFELDSPSRITFGAIGPVGQRLFVLQARQGANLVTLKLEKQQVASDFAEPRSDARRPAAAGNLPEETALEVESFDEPDFVVGTLALAYDAEDDRVVIITEEATAEDEVSGETARSRVPANRRAPSLFGECASSRPGGRRARSAAIRSIREATRARARTAIAPR